MRLSISRAFFFMLPLLLSFCGQAQAQAPTISSISPASGAVGSAVTIIGTNFGASQGSSTVSLNGTNAVVTSWNGEAITAIVPTGASSGSFSVTVSSQTANSSSFTVTPLPLSWSDEDIGSVGVAGSATYANGTFTVKGAGQGIYYSADQMNFAYQSLSGDGTIVARLVSLTGSGSEAGVTIRETLGTGSTHATPVYSASYVYLLDRTSTGGSTSYQYASATLPCWVKVVRSGSSLSGYQSSDGATWVQIGSSVTISMAQNVYLGLVVASGNNSALATATFDNVSISSAALAQPTISSVSATTGSVGTQVLISGSGFGSTENSSVVTLNIAPVMIDFWSDTSIVITIPSGATSGPMIVSVGPGMNDSNAVEFSVTGDPLPTSWLDQDIGDTGLAGSATYTGGTFTVQGSGTGVTGTADQLHFVYQPLSGDGTIIARLVSSTGTVTEAGVVIRETLSPGSKTAFPAYYYGNIYFVYRASTGGSASNQVNYTSVTPPYWIKLVRSGTTFSSYESVDGMTWAQVGTSQTISMAQNVYIGLGVSSTSNSSLGTATFDNVSINSAAFPAPVISGISATTGSVGSQVVISGSGFGATQGSSVVMLNDAPVTISSWSDTSIIVTIPSGATSGYFVVSVAPGMNDSNPVAFTVTSQPLPTPWLDYDVGPVGLTGSATYTGGTFTVKGSGTGVTGTADEMHFAYQPLSGDGTIIARLASSTGTLTEAGVMIRETLSPGSTTAFVAYYYGNIYFIYRTSTGGSASYGVNYTNVTPPYWIKLVRSGGTFAAYESSDGATWAQVGTSQTISMAQNVYVGLGASSTSNSSLGTATFDNVSVTVGTTPFVTGVSPVLGGIGTSVTIVGSNFGATQGTSTVNFNGTAASSISSWSSSQIVATVPTGATTGLVTVTVSSIQSISNASFTVINPVITSLEPPAAEINAEVIINGSGFGYSQSGSQVKFNGVVAGVVSWSDTAISVYVPSGTTTGPVTVTEDGITSSGVQFTVTGTLAVTSISPTSGPVGTSVTVSGTNFGATQSNSTVAFGGTNATVTSWSNTQIVAIVPSGASTGPVGVTVADVTASGPTFQVNATVAVTDSLGNQASYTSEIAGGKWYVSNAQGSGCSSCMIRGNLTTQFDSLGNVSSTTDELGNTTSFTYDSNNNLTQTTQPTVSAGTPTTTYTYNSFGEVLTMTDPLGHVTTNAYDSHGNLTSVTTPVPDSGISASVTQFAYNSLGEMTQITDPLGHVTTMTYTTAGLIATITDPQSHVTTYAYDSRGNRTNITDALSHVTSFAYDSGNRLTTITYPDSSTASFTYDYRGRRITATDQNGKTTTYAYDDADRVTSVTDPASNVTSYTYDTENNLLSITDASSHTTSFSYDAFGRVTQTTFLT